MPAPRRRLAAREGAARRQRARPALPAQPAAAAGACSGGRRLRALLLHRRRPRLCAALHPLPGARLWRQAAGQLHLPIQLTTMMLPVCMLSLSVLPPNITLLPLVHPWLKHHEFHSLLTPRSCCLCGAHQRVLRGHQPHLILPGDFCSPQGMATIFLSMSVCRAPVAHIVHAVHPRPGLAPAQQHHSTSRCRTVRMSTRGTAWLIQVLDCDVADACMHAGHHWRKLAPVQILALVAEYREREDEQAQVPGLFPSLAA